MSLRTGIKCTIHPPRLLPTLAGERYYIIRQEQFITLSGENYYIIRQKVYYIIRVFYYIIRQLLH